jgi:DNA-directed RNA polymerase specialized sigma24 family protein
MTTTYCISQTMRAALIEEHEPLVYRVAQECALKAGRHEYAERYDDFVSFLLVKLVECVDKLIARQIPVTNMRGLLIVMLRNEAIDYHRAGEDDILRRPGRGLERVAVRSLDDPLEHDGIMTLGEVIEDRRHCGGSERDYGYLYDAVETLPEALRQAVGVRFGLPGYGREENLHAAARERGLHHGTLSRQSIKGVKRLWALLAVSILVVLFSACTSEDIIRKDGLQSLYGTPVASMRPNGGGKVGSRAYYINLARTDALNAGIDPDCFQRQINQESGFNPAARGSSGEIGIAQFMPSTAAGLGINPYDPEQSLKGAAQLMGRFAVKYGDYRKALAAYNGGSGTLAAAMRNCGGAWEQCMSPITRAYIRIVMGG